MRTLDYLLDAFVLDGEKPLQPARADRRRKVRLSLPSPSVPLFHVWRP